MSEGELQRKVKTFLKRKGWMVIKFSDRYQSGIPDLVAIRGGVTWWIELKTEIGRLSGPQQETLAELEAAGANRMVLRPSGLAEFFIKMS